MREISNLKVKVESGGKYTTEQGFHAVKDGIRNKKENSVHIRKPEWLKVKKQDSNEYLKVKTITKKHKLSTVCEEAKCPNINECWSHGTATIMLMGSVCTRACKFCSVDTGNPKGWLDKDEPKNAAKSVKLMNLEYVVLTSVDRDDLEDGGAAHYAATISAIKQLSPEIKVEALTPDFGGVEQNIDKIINTQVDVIAQNIETVERLTHPVRDPRAGYWQTLNFLKYVKQKSSNVLTKTSIMVGLGETEEEIYKTMDDARSVGVDILTLGQYMQPTKHHLSVQRFVTPAQFDEYRKVGLAKGFLEVASGPMVRSSYRADRVFKRNNLDL
ncbi:lipoic acid synthetase [Allofrancisella inopinata]|uniref:Lipoyl synthase n=1 Tax=Allofrancisella inopinata TaxID=1085647 RepID=A0AAE6YHK5_9GAMM|nr:lipoyl synthase [Allofrancisella inopinata]QIV95998.1 lipoyl synthase [Allofrancisella inopinata]TDT74421.1 lipoic acid synthetase [Allofrancisella inopinata]